MSKRTSLAEFLAAANLSGASLERERIKAQRDSDQTASLASLLKEIPNLAAQGLSAADQAANEAAMQKAQKAILDNRDARGNGFIATSPEGNVSSGYEMAPSELAKQKLGSLQPKKDGNFIENILADPLGFNSRAATKAELAAQGQMADRIDANRSKDLGDAQGKAAAMRTKAEKQAQLDAIKNKMLADAEANAKRRSGEIEDRDLRFGHEASQKDLDRKARADQAARDRAAAKERAQIMASQQTDRHASSNEDKAWQTAIENTKFEIGNVAKEIENQQKIASDILSSKSQQEMARASIQALTSRRQQLEAHRGDLMTRYEELRLPPPTPDWAEYEPQDSQPKSAGPVDPDAAYSALDPAIQALVDEQIGAEIAAGASPAEAKRRVMGALGE